MATAVYTIQVDWGNDGTWTDSGDDVTTRVREYPGISTTRGRDQIRELSPPTAGRFDALLDNQSRDYSAEYGASPLAGNLLPGRPVRLRATYSATTYDLWRGFLDDLPQYPHRTELSVGVPALGPLSKLAGKRISTGLYSSIRTDTALGYILDAVDWPAGDRTLDTGETTLDWWWLNDEDALSAALEILRTEGPGAALYESGDGKIVFEGRHYRLTTSRSTTSQATLRDGGTEPLYSVPFRYEQGLKNIINSATMTAKTRSADALAVIWSLGSTVTLSASETRKYLATASDPFTGALLQNATDYTVTAGSLTTAALNRTSGQNATITLTAGASGATVTGLQVRAQAVTVDNTVLVTSTVSASTSQTRYGIQPYDYDIRAEIPVNTAQDLVNAIVARYQEPRPQTIVTANNGADARMTQILSREISDRVTIVESQTGVDHDYHIERIQHQITNAGRLHEGIFGCEKVSTFDYMAFGIGAFGSGVFGF